MNFIILSLVVYFSAHTIACSFSFGDDAQHGYCTYYTTQNPYFPANIDCYMDCKCKVNKTTGVSYMATRGCLESYPCYNPDGSLRNFNEEYVSDNVIGNCYIYNKFDECGIECRCKSGFRDYRNTDGKLIKCGTCPKCKCDVNLTTGTNDCPNGYKCDDNFLDRINLNNTINCIANGPNCDLSCTCKPKFGKFNGIECDKCIDCVCPFNLTDGKALSPLGKCEADDYCKNTNGQIETFSNKYVPDNVDNCWVTYDSNKCKLNCECKPKYTNDGDILCGKLENSAPKKKRKFIPFAIFGITIGSIVALVIVVGIFVGIYHECNDACF